MLSRNPLTHSFPFARSMQAHINSSTRKLSYLGDVIDIGATISGCERYSSDVSVTYSPTTPTSTTSKSILLKLVPKLFL